MSQISQKDIYGSLSGRVVNFKNRKEREMTSLSGAHSSSLQSESSEEARTAKRLRFLTGLCLSLVEKNKLEEVKVLAERIACEADAIVVVCER